jgi:hypothetical protein
MTKNVGMPSTLLLIVWSLNNFYKFIQGMIAFIPGKDKRAETIAKKAIVRIRTKIDKN